MTQSAKLYLSKVKHVSGWFAEYDVEMFLRILQYQKEQAVTGDVLEIGVFEGKSAILLGGHIAKEEKLHVCDTFSIVTDGLNQEENYRSYPGLKQAKFIGHYLEFNPKAPTVYECKSTDLEGRITHKKFRFIHIDGSHIYENVKSDIRLASKLLDKEYGVIVVDDFRAQHTFGVALAVWKLVSEGEYLPIVITASKIYLAHTTSKIEIEKFAQSLNGIEFLYESLNGKKFLRTIGVADENQYRRNSLIRSLLPPAFLNLLRGITFLKRLM